MEYYEVTEREARIRNLRFAVLKKLVSGDFNIDYCYSEKELLEVFSFRKSDIAFYVPALFDYVNEKYVLKSAEKERMQKMMEIHETAMTYMQNAKVKFEKIYGSYMDELELTSYSYKLIDQFSEVYQKVEDVLMILHWSLLPIIPEYLMVNGNRIPEYDIEEFYDQFHCIKALLSELRGEGAIMNNKGDDTLDKEMKFPVYTRRWGHSETYRIKRTVSGWHVSYISLHGDCDREGSPWLYNNLKHEAVFYPEEAVKYAMKSLWQEAEDGELTPDELQEKLMEVADWISAVEKVVGEKQPGWVNYY